MLKEIKKLVSIINHSKLHYYPGAELFQYETIKVALKWIKRVRECEFTEWQKLYTMESSEYWDNLEPLGNTDLPEYQMLKKVRKKLGKVIQDRPSFFRKGIIDELVRSSTNPDVKKASRRPIADNNPTK